MTAKDALLHEITLRKEQHDKLLESIQVGLEQDDSRALLARAHLSKADLALTAAAAAGESAGWKNALYQLAQASWNLGAAYVSAKAP